MCAFLLYISWLRQNDGDRVKKRKVHLLGFCLDFRGSSLDWYWGSAWIDLVAGLMRPFFVRIWLVTAIIVSRYGTFKIHEIRAITVMFAYCWGVLSAYHINGIWTVIKPYLTPILYYDLGIKCVPAVFENWERKQVLQIGLGIVLGLVFTTIFYMINTPIRKKTTQKSGFFQR